MSNTVLDVITAAMQNLGVIAIDETPSAAEAAQGLSILIDMLDTWQSESLTIFTVQPHVFPFVANKGAYTLGAGGDLNISRPVKIMYASVRYPDGTTDLPVEIIDVQKYSAIVIKTITSTFPYMLYDDNNFPLKTLYFYPVPQDGTYSMVLWVWQLLSSPSTLTAIMSFPPGYTEGLKTNLAVRMGPRFGRQVSPDLKEQADKAKARIQRSNTVIPEMIIDKRLTHKQGYNQQDFYAGK